MNAIGLLANARPAIEDIALHLRYQPDTGDFFWLRPGRRRHVGEKAGTYCDGYVQIQVLGYRTRAHRIAWALTHGTWPCGEVDHINGIRDDNRIQNLRDVPRAINQQNRIRAQSNNKLGILGVHASVSRGGYVAMIKVSGRTKNLGIFESVEQASEAYIAAKRIHHAGGTL